MPEPKLPFINLQTLNADTEVTCGFCMQPMAFQHLHHHLYKVHSINASPNRTKLLKYCYEMVEPGEMASCEVCGARVLVKNLAKHRRKNHPNR